MVDSIKNIMKPGEKKKKKRSKVYRWPISARSFTIPYSSIDSPHKKKKNGEDLQIYKKKNLEHHEIMECISN